MDYVLDGFMNIMHVLDADYLNNTVRSPDAWKSRLKTKDRDRHFMDFIRFCFVRYHIPKFMDVIWKCHSKRDVTNSIFRKRDNDTEKRISIDFFKWYVCMGNGGSVYKECAKGILSKKETATFIRYGSPELNPYENLWYARCLCRGGKSGWSHNIARTLNRRAATPFYIEVMEFFIQNPVHIREMKELVDFMDDMHVERPNWSLKKRTLESIRILSVEWHRIQAKRREYIHLTWCGHAIDNWEHDVPDKNSTQWRIEQILTSKELVKEGHDMRHCVASYADSCRRGHCSIWSVTMKNMHDASWRKMLTIEIQDDGSNYTMKQVRGYCNRSAYSKEREILKMWCEQNGIGIGYHIW